MFGNPETYTQRASALLGMAGGSGSSTAGSSSSSVPRNTFSRKAVPDRHYYDVLGIEHDANADQINRAYQEARRARHPDAPGGSAAMFLEVQEAYKVLSNESARRAYDTYGMPGAKMALGTPSAPESRQVAGKAPSVGPAAVTHGGLFDHSTADEHNDVDAPAWGSFDQRGRGVGAGSRARSRFDPFSGVSMEDAWSTGTSTSSLEDLYGVRSMFDYGEPKAPVSATSTPPKESTVVQKPSGQTSAGSRPSIPSAYGFDRTSSPSPSANVNPGSKSASVVVAQVRTTLAELRFHQEREVTFRLPAPSAETSKHLAQPSTTPVACEECVGKGYSIEYDGDCNACGGTGREDNRASVAFQLAAGNGVCRWCAGCGQQAIAKHPCDVCSGTGRVAGSSKPLESSSKASASERATDQVSPFKTKTMKVPVRATARDGEVVGEFELDGGWIGRAVVVEQKHAWLRRDREEGKHLWVVAKRRVEGCGWEIPYLDETGRDAFWGCLSTENANRWQAGDVVKVEGFGLVPKKSNLYVVLRPQSSFNAQGLIAAKAKSATKDGSSSGVLTASLVPLSKEECQKFDVPTVGLVSRRHEIEIALDLPL